MDLISTGWIDTRTRALIAEVRLRSPPPRPFCPLPPRGISTLRWAYPFLPAPSARPWKWPSIDPRPTLRASLLPPTLRFTPCTVLVPSLPAPSLPALPALSFTPRPLSPPSLHSPHPLPAPWLPPTSRACALPPPRNGRATESHVLRESKTRDQERSSITRATLACWIP